MRFSIHIEARLTAGPEIFCSHKHVRYAMTSEYIPNAFKRGESDSDWHGGTRKSDTPETIRRKESPKRAKLQYTLILTRYWELGASGS